MLNASTESRVEELKTTYESGEYEVPPEELARRILDLAKPPKP